MVLCSFLTWCQETQGVHECKALPQSLLKALPADGLTEGWSLGGAQEQEEGDSSVINHHFVQQALQPLVAMLLSELTKQEEGQDEDDGAWNLSMAGGTCLGLVASVVGDDILAIIMPYVQVPPAAAFALPSLTTLSL